MLVEVEVGGLHQRHLAGEQLRHHGVGRQIVVGIGQVAVGRDDDRDPRRGPVLGRAHHEGDVVLGRRRFLAADPEPGGVEAALQPLRRGERKIRVPAGIVDVVVVEVDGAVFLPRMVVDDLVAGPVVAGHAARRQVDRVAVEHVRRGVDDVGGRDALGDVGLKVPGAHHDAPQVGGAALEAARERVDPVLVEGHGGEARTVDLAVVASALLGQRHRGRSPPCSGRRRSSGPNPRPRSRQP